MFQKRLDGSVDFYRGWTEYKRGFGNLTGEFWLGLDNIHNLTTNGSYKLRVDVEDFAGNIYYAEFDHFEVSSEIEKYQLSVGNYKGMNFYIVWNRYHLFLGRTKTGVVFNKQLNGCHFSDTHKWKFRPNKRRFSVPVRVFKNSILVLSKSNLHTVKSSVKSMLNFRTNSRHEITLRYKHIVLNLQYMFRMTNIDHQWRIQVNR